MVKATLGALFPGREPVVQHFRNARGNGGERPGLSGLSGLLLGGRSWRQRSPPPAPYSSSPRKGQVLGATAFFTVRAA